MTLIKNRIYRVMLASLLIALLSEMVSGDECSASCGYVAPTTYMHFGRGCADTGFLINNYTLQINWSDGSYSALNYNFSLQLSIGSCCSRFTTSEYWSAIVTDGRFAGQSAILINTVQSDNQVCVGCQTNSGLTRLAGNILLAIGTKGGGQWIECTGTSTVVYSPGVMSTPHPIRYTTILFDFADCSNCVESC